MKSTMSLHTFRKIARTEEMMIRAMMPRTNAADPMPLPLLHAGENTRRTTRTLTLAPLTFRMSEVRCA